MGPEAFVDVDVPLTPSRLCSNGTGVLPSNQSFVLADCSDKRAIDGARRVFNDSMQHVVSAGLTHRG